MYNLGNKEVIFNEAFIIPEKESALLKITLINEEWEFTLGYGLSPKREINKGRPLPYLDWDFNIPERKADFYFTGWVNVGGNLPLTPFLSGTAGDKILIIYLLATISVSSGMAHIQLQFLEERKDTKNE